MDSVVGRGALAVTALGAAEAVAALAVSEEGGSVEMEVTAAAVVFALNYRKHLRCPIET